MINRVQFSSLNCSGALFFWLVLCFLGAVLANAESINKVKPTLAPKPTIIALSPHIVEMLYDIGAGEQIIATTDFDDYPEQAKNIPRIGNYIRLQIERIIELNPDLIIAWKSGNPSDDLTRLKQLGFKVVYSQPNTFEDIAKEMKYFAQLTGHRQQGEELTQQFLIELTRLKSDYKEKKRITAFYELWSRPLTTVAKKSWVQQHLDICQVSNPFEQATTPFPQVNIEQVINHPIEIIIQPLSVNQVEREGFNWQDWPIIPAVKNHRIIRPDADGLHRMTLRSLNELKNLCQRIDQIRQTLVIHEPLGEN